MIVLYSQYRANWGTNMWSLLYNIILLLPLRLGSVPFSTFSTYGVRSPLCKPLCIICFWSYPTQLPSSPPGLRLV